VLERREAFPAADEFEQLSAVGPDIDRIDQSDPLDRVEEVVVLLLGPVEFLGPVVGDDDPVDRDLLDLADEGLQRGQGTSSSRGDCALLP
jgi:hypothetical protein